MELLLHSVISLEILKFINKTGERKRVIILSFNGKTREGSSFIHSLDELSSLTVSSSFDYTIYTLYFTNVRHLNDIHVFEQTEKPLSF